LASSHAALLLQEKYWELISNGSVLSYVVLAVLLIFSIYSWTVIFAKWSAFGSAQKTDARFLRAFRKANGLVAVFDSGYEEVSRQVKSRGSLGNRDAIMRSLQIGTNQQLSRLERNLSWLATTASVSPFIGLFGTVLGIIRAFQNLTGAGSASLSSVGPGIADALVATAAGLFAAIPAAMAYNYFGHSLKEIGGQMDDFSLEFLNLIERSFGE
jgi:biopolymer transport protein TolQ